MSDTGATNSAKRSPLVPLAMLIFAATIYSMTFSLNQIAITEGIPVFPFVFWQGLGTAVVAFVASLITRQLPSLRRNYLQLYLLFGFVGIALPYTLLAFAAPKVPAGAIALGLALTPILTYVFSVLFRLDRVRLLRIAGILFGLAGILLVVLPGQSLPDPSMAPWLLMAFGAPLCYAFGTVAVALLRPPESRPIPLTCGLSFVSAILMVPVMAATDSWWIFDANMTDGDWALIGIIFINATFFVVALEIIRMAGPVFYSTNGYLGTLIGLGWAALYFGEVPSPWIWAAVALLFVGLFMVNRTSTPAAAPAAQ
jgi:drug/metabolite transporter (DMT)-like permease